ncbi:MAG: glycoside hydrolase family 78 protein [Marinilabiliales bacterium]|nr:glycoside hydrolase family 78 protein [Marinilabiliales bacterium]
MKYKKILLLWLFLLPTALYSANGLRVTVLTCEHLTHPLGVDELAPRLSWQTRSPEKNFVQSAYEIEVFRKFPEGGRQKVWGTGKVTSDISFDIAYAGNRLDPATRYEWKVRVWNDKGKASDWSESAWWETGLMDPGQWKGKFVAVSAKKPDDHRPVCFRREFVATKTIVSARLYVTSLGLYQFFINGQKAGNDLFTPGWTSYNKRLQYQVYDVTPLVKKGDNALTALVGDGWYRGNIGGKIQRNYFGDQLALLAQLEVRFQDGTMQRVTTDESWQGGDGPLLASDIYNGESYDATLEQPGWQMPSTSPLGFQPVTVLDKPLHVLIASRSVPVRAVGEIHPVKILRTPRGETVFDMGQNMVGWTRLRVKGNRGDKVILSFAEVLDKNGNFYTENLRKAKATDEYRLRGGETEVFEPHFTFHGFRFVMVEGLPGLPDLNTLTGIVIHSDMVPSGNFSCSDSLINQLQHNIVWGQKGNSLDVPTDCPQRDERLGWTGDAQVFAPTAAFNFDVQTFFSKWLADVSADQLPDGKITDVVPDVRSGRGGSAAWGDVVVMVPWTLYQRYGDKQILADGYPAMKAWVEYMHGRAGSGNLWRGDSQYGDWLAFATTQSDYPGATTEKDLVATAFYAHSAALLSQIAALLGKESDALSYKELSAQVKASFCHEYLAPSGRLVSNTQTAYCLALAFHLLPEEQRQKAADHLAEDVRKMNHLTTGFVGTPLLCQSLADYGYADLAFQLLTNKEYPSWLYPVTQGATTIWERWDGQKPDGTFQDPKMNSFNHYAYGAIGDWLYGYVAGIRPDPESPGYHHFFLNPHAGGGLTHAEATLETRYGKIISSWRLAEGQMVLDCTVPENSYATLQVELVSPGSLQEEGKPVLPVGGGIAFTAEKGSLVSLRLGSGKHHLTWPDKGMVERK